MIDVINLFSENFKRHLEEYIVHRGEEKVECSGHYEAFLR
jgi:hypothetical protein